jgi:hypothetical protein
MPGNEQYAWLQLESEYSTEIGLRCVRVCCVLCVYACVFVVCVFVHGFFRAERPFISGERFVYDWLQASTLVHHCTLQWLSRFAVECGAAKLAQDGLGYDMVLHGASVAQQAEGVLCKAFHRLLVVGRPSSSSDLLIEVKTHLYRQVRRE